MHAPSLKSFKLLTITRGQAESLRREIHAATTSDHAKIDSILSLANDYMNAHGTESIRGREVVKHYGDINLLYVNTGDTYYPTLIYDTYKQRFIVSSWGDLVETQPRRFDI